MKVRVPREAWLARLLMSRAGRVLILSFALVSVAGLGVFTYYYTKYSKLIDQKLRAGPFANTSKIYAAPRLVSVGDPMSIEEIVADLRRAGYSDQRNNAIGSFHVRPDAVEIFPGPDSYFDRDPAVLKFKDGKISRIVALSDNTARMQYQLEPQLITNLFDRNREKRRLVKFQDIPKVLVDAITSSEDKRFFQHAGFDPIRIIKALYVDIKEGRKREGASTLSMQLARGLWLNLEKRWGRKAAEALITLQLEQKLSKQEIFEHYANQVYLGWRGGFRIHGFGEGAEAYFGKDISQLTLLEAATLAGMIHRPSLSPYIHPDKVKERRNIVLVLMRENGRITDREYAVAVEAPLVVAKGAALSLDAPYFVDLVNDTLQQKFQDFDFQNNSFRVYTTLDLDLQRAAGEAVRMGMQDVDERIRKQRRFRGMKQIPEAQCALVALDPHTGQIKALVGGRNYGVSQLNHVLAKRQPGSVFKPFVYAAALDTALEGRSRILTAGSTVVDQPTTFWFDNKPYEPSNFEHKFYGTVTLRQALAHSMNVATVKVAEMVGYASIVDLANRAGLNYNIQPTPAVALGAYEVTPVEMAGAYTMYANEGTLVKPYFLSLVRSQTGKTIHTGKTEKSQVLDPRVAYLMTNLMEEVMRSGTAAGTRARGFTVPAAGKTGTSHDGWFAGYTSELLCIVWVGFDDNRTLDLEGAHSALPIWTEFMKRALGYRPYRNVKPFQAPDGIVTIQIDPATGMPATPYCPSTRAEVYLAGTQPVGACPLHGGSAPGVTTNVAGWEMPPSPPAVQEPAIIGSRGDGIRAVAAQHQPAAVPQPEPAKPEKAEEQPKQKKSIFRRILGVFK